MPIAAKYATRCSACGGRIEPGAPIAAATGGQGWSHEECPAGLFDPTVPETLSDTASAASAASEATVEAAATTGGVTEVWTDGACSGNPGPGGWAWATPDGRQGSGGAPHTTNQRMEIQAALEAVTALPRPLVIVSDSTYVVNCFRDRWWRGWLARGWMTSAKKPVANQDLWKPLVEAVTSADAGSVTFRWVKGHSGDTMNDLVDQLAVAAAAAQR